MEKYPALLKIKLILTDILLVNLSFLFVFSLLLSSSVFANTLGEAGTAAGIANTLQGTTQIQQKGILDKAKQIVQKYEEAQNNQFANVQSINSEANPSAIQQNTSDPSSASPDTHPPIQDLPLIDPTDPDIQAVISNNQPTIQEPPLTDSAPYSKEELDKRLQDEEIQQETQPVDYKRKTQIFYKRECKVSQENCDRGAVLTNIKSLIFDYAHKRGSFSEMEKAKN